MSFNGGTGHDECLVRRLTDFETSWQNTRVVQRLVGLMEREMEVERRARKTEVVGESEAARDFRHEMRRIWGQATVK
jgi:hypothetical protein